MGVIWMDLINLKGAAILYHLKFVRILRQYTVHLYDSLGCKLLVDQNWRPKKYCCWHRLYLVFDEVKISGLKQKRQSFLDLLECFILDFPWWLGLVGDLVIDAITRLEFKDSLRTGVYPGGCCYPCGNKHGGTVWSWGW